MKQRFRIGTRLLYRLLYTRCRVDMSEQCRYFDATGGCDLLFSQTAKHERLTFTGKRNSAKVGK